MTRIRLAGCAAVFAALTIGLAGCGGDEPEPGQSQAVPSDLPTDLPTATPSGTVSAGKPAKLPAGFPLPAGTKKGDFTENGTGAVTGTVTVKDGSKAYDYWVKQLPKDGYEITSKNKVDLSGVNALITFQGKSYSSATITIRNTNAAISLQK